ncbi:MAG TPA: NfeD family protein [Pirellulaceae bacterium]|nr:NfeD family protein [Pirellulaceae bacterium]
MSFLGWALLLLLLGCIFLVLEFFIPSSGTLGVLAGLSLVAAIVLAFLEGPVQGTGMVIAVSIIVPTACLVAVKYWPHTPIGRLILIQRPERPEEVLPETEGYRGLAHLVGRKGQAKSVMLPAGAVQIDGRTYDAVSEGMAIDPGTAVVVVSVSMQRIVVRPDDSPVPAELVPDLEIPSLESSPAPETTAAAAQPEPLANPFEDPLP